MNKYHDHFLNLPINYFLMGCPSRFINNIGPEADAGHGRGYDEKADQFGSDLYQEKVTKQLLSAGLSGDQLEREVRVRVNRVKQVRFENNMRYFGAEVDRVPDQTTEWEIRADGELYNPKDDTTLRELFENTEKYYKQEGLFYNQEEANAVLNIAAALVSGDGAAGTYLTFDHRGTVRYATQMAVKEGKITSTYIDIGLVAGRDLTWQEATKMMSDIEDRHASDNGKLPNSPRNYPYFITREPVSTREVKVSAVTTVKDKGVPVSTLPLVQESMKTRTNELIIQTNIPGIRQNQVMGLDMFRMPFKLDKNNFIHQTQNSLMEIGLFLVRETKKRVNLKNQNSDNTVTKITTIQKDKTAMPELEQTQIQKEAKKQKQKTVVVFEQKSKSTEKIKIKKLTKMVINSDKIHQPDGVKPIVTKKGNINFSKDNNAVLEKQILKLIKKEQKETKRKIKNRKNKPSEKPAVYKIEFKKWVKTKEKKKHLKKKICPEKKLNHKIREKIDQKSGNLAISVEVKTGHRKKHIPERKVNRLTQVFKKLSLWLVTTDKKTENISEIQSERVIPKQTTTGEIFKSKELKRRKNRRIRQAEIKKNLVNLGLWLILSQLQIAITELQVNNPELKIYPEEHDVQPEKPISPFVLAMIIWYLAQIKEQGRSTYVKTKKKTKKTTGVIYLANHPFINGFRFE